MFVLPLTVDKAEGEDLLSHAALAGWGKTAEDNKYASLVAGSEYNRYKRVKSKKEEEYKRIEEYKERREKDEWRDLSL